MKERKKEKLLPLQVVLAANDMPALNDITYLELTDIISKVNEAQTNMHACMYLPCFLRQISCLHLFKLRI